MREVSRASFLFVRKPLRARGRDAPATAGRMPALPRETMEHPVVQNRKTAPVEIRKLACWPGWAKYPGIGLLFLR
jgi:hypothetical protein